MNRLISKFFKLNVEDRYFIHSVALSDSLVNIRNFAMFLDNENWYECVGNENYFFKQNLQSFIDKNRNNIILKEANKFETTKGLYLHPTKKFGFSFYINNIKGTDRFSFVSTSKYEEELKSFVKDNFIIKKYKKEIMMSLLLENRGDYYLEEYEVNSIADLNLEDNYNDDFIEIDEKLNNTILNTKKSLNILHGLPGTGKTTYIKNLCHRLAKKGLKIVYLPPSITQILSSPGFINNLELFRDKVVIIEDAEEVLSQSTHRSQAISNILNITDGILADIYNIHFIFTFNMDVRKIDEALLRKGRLTLKYEFKELSKDKIDNLSKKLNINSPIKGTLSEIYNIDSNGSESSITKLGY